MYGNNYGNYGYNMGYGVPAQQSYSQAQQSFMQGYPQAQQRVNDDRIWVQGEVGAKAYLVAPGATATLWDSERPIIYLKSVGANGMPTMQKLPYTVDNQPATPAPSTTLDKSFEDRLERLEKAFETFKQEASKHVQQSNADASGV